MNQTHDLMMEVAITGQRRETRSGMVRGVFKRDLKWDLREGLPFPTTKRLMLRACIGELLMFINGCTTLSSLRHYSNAAQSTSWTIWSNDCNRWHSNGIARYDVDDNVLDADDLGRLYGAQWRRFGETKDHSGVDQLANLVENMKNSPMSRYLIVQAYNPIDIDGDMAALPPCHTGFQVYVDAETGEFDLDWTQRSVDTFLGLPFNIASYAILMLILGQLTGLKPRFLTGSLKDVHIYEAHLPAVYEQLQRVPQESDISLILPKFDTLDDLASLTAQDFIVENYHPEAAIKAPLLVG